MPITEQEAQKRLNAIPNNTLPEGWRKITEEEFAQSMFFTYSPLATSYTQFYAAPEYKSRRWELPNAGDVPGSAKLFMFHDGTGLAIAADYWGGKVGFFKFGCEHEVRELSVQECRERGIYHAGRVYHVYECVKCGNVESYDTSD